VLLAQLVQQEQQAPLVPLDLWDWPDQPVPLELRGHWVVLEPLVHKAVQAPQAFKGLLEQMVLQVLLGHWEVQVLQAH